MFINTFRYTPEDVDCRLCTAFTRKDGCTAPRCLYLAERIEAGVVGYEELLRESVPADSVFRWRLRMLLETFDGTLWQNEKHIRRGDPTGGQPLLQAPGHAEVLCRFVPSDLGQRRVPPRGTMLYQAHH